ncbi:MAG TPA: class I SAM-dependent methyltransferase [Thermoguttaceae bacterium]|nr:class I SAM-dependent methyltransferase [Thermoguttaceae bacterium]
MPQANPITLTDVQAVYGGPEADLWELIMGQQIHLGGLTSSMDLAEKAGIAAGTQGVDFCCCTGAGMRFLVRFRGVGRMTGVDATEKMVRLGRRRCEEEGMANRISFILGDVCASGLPDASVDFVWGEDAWCYVVDKPRMIAEAARIVRPGGVVAFTDWIEGDAGLAPTERERLLRFMKFPNVQTRDGYASLLRDNNCSVLHAEDTGRFAPCVDLYLNMISMQFGYDALRIIGFDQSMLEAIGGEMQFMQGLAHAGKIAQGLFVARRTA